MKRPCSAAFLLFLSIRLMGGPRPESPPPAPGPIPAPADSVLLWVFLDPAAVMPAAVPALSRHALEQRFRLGLPVFDSDRALPSTLLDRLESAGVSVRHSSRWLRAVSAHVDPADLPAVLGLPEVRGVWPVAHLEAAGPARIRPRARDVGRGGSEPFPAPHDADSTYYGRSWPALRALGVPAAHGLGFTGQGIRIAVLDAGFDTGHEALASVRVVGVRDFVDGGSQVGEGTGDAAAHGTAVWSVLAAAAPGALVGPAYGAEFLLARVDDDASATRADEDRWIAALEWADSMGARIVQSSVVFRRFDDGSGYDAAELDGRTTPATLAALEAARRGILVVTAVGDRDRCEGSLCAPADADSILAVGATDSGGSPAPFSGFGPTADGRTKPDLVAPGVDLPFAEAGTVAGYATDSGTSFASPLIAGAAALVLEAWPEFGPMAVRRALLLAGDRAEAPDRMLGRGAPSAAAALLFPLGLELLGVVGVDGDGVLTTIAPGFGWSAPIVHPLARPVRYRLELAADERFEQVVQRDSVTDAFAMTLSRPARPADALWWRITAETAQGVRHGPAPAGPLTMPRWVRLRTLNDPAGSFTESVRPTLVWSPLSAPPPAGPLRFDVAVLSAETGATVAALEAVEDTFAVVPEPLNYNVSYRWRVIARSPAGVADTVESAAPFVVSSAERPPATLLHQNFPNPFPRSDLGEAATRIWFDLDRRSDVVLAVHDLRGRRVRGLIPAAGCGPVTLEPGLYGRDGDVDACVLTRWDGRDDAGRVVPAGVYLLRLRASGAAHVRRVLFLPD